MAEHLLNGHENDHVTVHELRGVAAHDLEGALLEIDASKACTKATKPFFSVQLCPPEGSHIEHSTAAYEHAAALIEEKYPELAKQARIMVFHEKNGRRHGHAVWSRIDTEQGKAVQLSHDYDKLADVSRTMYRTYGLDMPKGYENSHEADPRNYGIATWQQCKRMGEDPRDLKRIVQEAFQHSDGQKAFAAALEGHALMLARGDRRGFVVVHHSGEVIGLRQCLPDKTLVKDIRARIGDEKECITVDQAQSQLSARMTASAEKRVDDLKRRHAQENQPYRDAVLHMRDVQQADRQLLKETQDERTAQEELARGQRLRTGIVSIWDRLTGRHGRVAKENHQEAEAAHERDRQERDAQIKAQLEERRQLQERVRKQNARHTSERNKERAVLGDWLSMDKDSARHAAKAHIEQIGDMKKGYQSKHSNVLDAFGKSTSEEARSASAQRKKRDERLRGGKGNEHEM